MDNRDNNGEGLIDEIRRILSHAREVWHFIPMRHKLGLGLAAGLMALVSACSTAFPLLLGRLLDDVKTAGEGGVAIVAQLLGLMAWLYLLRESLQVARRYLVENACTRIEKALTIQVFAHLIKVDLAALGEEKIGALQGASAEALLGRFASFVYRFSISSRRWSRDSLLSRPR